MSATIRKEFTLEGLCCGNCAAKIEREVKKLDGVTTAIVDFMSKMLSLEIQDQEEANIIVAQINAIVKKHDSDITLIEKETVAPGKKSIYLLGLCCADCASKIERQVNQLEGVKASSIDFISQKLTIEVFDKKDLPGVLRQASQIALSIEPDLHISYTDKKEDENLSTNWEKWAYRCGLLIGSGIFSVGMILDLTQNIEFVLFLISYLLIGGEVVYRALKNISKGQLFDENFLMSVATIGAFAIGEYPEGVAVMLFYQVGEAFQKLAVNRSRKSISSLMDIRPDYANLIHGDELQKVSPEEVGIGDLIVVKPGEKVPLDGVIIQGKSALDTSALTGESLPKDVEIGNEILSGSINKNGLLTIEITKEFGESTISKILDLVQNASSKKAPTENFITKFARYYTPFIVFASAALAFIPPFILPEASFAEWINRALVFLVVSCPCALVISIPLSFFGGIGGASKNGILIKGSNYLEALNNVDTVVFDKTGTLTKGVFKVTEILPSGNWSSTDLLYYAAYAEAHSTHPIAVSILKEYGKNIDFQKLTDYEEKSGLGIRVKIDNKTVLAGNSKLMDLEGISYPILSELGSVVYLAIEGSFSGTIVISDEMKSDSKQAIKDLRNVGVRKIAMLTGDTKKVGEKIATELDLDMVYADLLPHQKVEQLEALDKQKHNSKGKLIFVGDGINDAPVLARADVGFAMGGVGSDAAIEAADVVLMTDEPSKIVAAIQIAKKTRNIVWQNIIFALGVKAVILVLGALGIATMWEAVFGDVGVAVIAILNAMRSMRVVK